MGVDYYKCSECGECLPSEYIDYIDIEGYETIAMCNSCRGHNMDAGPRKSLDLEDIEDIDVYFTAREKKEDSESVSFKTFEEMRAWVLEHYRSPGCVFGKYEPTTHEEAEEMLKLFEADCRQMAWEDIEKGDLNTDNTKFKPKREWLEAEHEHIVDKIDQLNCKKIKLENMLSK
jgi:hypothetical protein